MKALFEPTPDFLKYLDELKSELNASSRGEVLRHALAVMGWTTEKVNAGYRIFAVPVDDPTVEWVELSNPLLDRIVPQKTADASFSHEI